MIHNTNSAPLWTDMTREDFGEDPAPVQDALFPEPDPTGTLDMLDNAEG